MNRLLLLMLLASLAPLSVQAATLHVSADPAQVGVGDLVKITVTVDSAVPVNAFSGALTFGPALLPLTVSDGNSIVPLWISHPASAEGSVPFAGIIPGGYSGSGGELFAVIFRAARAGPVQITLAGTEALRNDGKGTEEPVRVEPLSLTIAASAKGGFVESEDHTPPEQFSAYLGTDPEVEDGRAYLVFSTVDKGSGVDRYLVAESRWPRFIQRFFPLSFATATSPYLLADQNLTHTVYIEAVDRAGNVQRAVFPPQRLLSSTEEVVFLLLLIVVALLWQGIRRRRSLP